MSHPVARFLRKITKRLFRLRARTRAILVVVGCIAMASSWFLPWYNIDYWVSPAASDIAMRSGHYEFVDKVVGAPLVTQKYSQDAVLQIEYTGAQLSRGGAATHDLGLSQKVFDSFLVLGALALLVVWTDEWKRATGVTRFLKRVVDYTAFLGLLVEVFWCVWRAGRATSLLAVHQMATALIVKDLGGAKAAAAGVAFVYPLPSVGYLSLLFGLVLTSIGILTGDRPEPSGSASGERAIRTTWITAGVLVIGGLIYLFVTVALFGSEAPTH